MNYIQPSVNLHHHTNTISIITISPGRHPPPAHFETYNSPCFSLTRLALLGNLFSDHTVTLAKTLLILLPDLFLFTALIGT